MRGRSGGSQEELLALRAQIKAENAARADPKARRDEVHGERRTLVTRQGEGVLRPNLGGGGALPALPGIVGWWGARFETAYIDGSLVPNTVDGSGQGHNAVASGSARPTFKTAIINGLPVFRFDGVATTLGAAAAVIANQPITLFTVAKITTKVSFGVFLGGLGNRCALLSDSAGAAGVYGGTVAMAATGDTSAAFHIYEGVINGASSECGVDGTVFIGLNANTTLAAETGIALGGNGSSFLTGDIAEGIACAGILSVQHRTLLRRYLGRLYGIAVP
jgi:hypothetical protein